MLLVIFISVRLQSHDCLYFINSQDFVNHLQRLSFSTILRILLKLLAAASAVVVEAIILSIYLRSHKKICYKQALAIPPAADSVHLADKSKLNRIRRSLSNCWTICWIFRIAQHHLKKSRKLEIPLSKVIMH